MQQLEMSHPNVYSEFAAENHFIQSCSGKLRETSSATLNLERSSILRAIPNIFPVSFFLPFISVVKAV